MADNTGLPHFPQNLASDGLSSPQALHRTWSSRAVLAIHHQKAVAEPACREKNEDGDGAKRLPSSLRHRERLVRAVVAHASPDTMTPHRGLGRRTALIRSRRARFDLGGMVRSSAPRRLEELGAGNADHRLLRLSGALRPRRSEGRRRWWRWSRRAGATRWRRERWHPEHRVLANSLLRRDATRPLHRGGVGLLVNSNARLIEPVRPVIAHRVTAFASERSIGGDFGSTLGTIHDAPLPYQKSF